MWVFLVSLDGGLIWRVVVVPFLGPCIGPIVGGYIGDNTSWRWIYYTLLIFTGLIFVLMVFTIPETYTPIILKRRAKKMRKERGGIYLSKQILKLTLALSRICWRSAWLDQLSYCVENWSCFWFRSICLSCTVCYICSPSPIPPFSPSTKICRLDALVWCLFLSVSEWSLLHFALR